MDTDRLLNPVTQLQVLLDDIEASITNATYSSLFPQLDALFLLMSSISYPNSRIEHQSLDECSSLLKGIFSQIFTRPDILAAVWKFLLDGSELLPKSLGYKRRAVLRLYNGYRIINNYFGFDLKWFVSNSDYTSNVTNALPLVFTDQWISLYNHFTTDVKLSLCNRLLKDKHFCEVVLVHLNSDNVCEVLSLSIRLVRQHSSLYERTSLPLVFPHFEYILRECIQLVCALYSIYSAIDLLLFQRCQCGLITESIVASMPSHSMLDAIDVIASIWGERSFISRGNLLMQKQLTLAILLALERVNGEDLSNYVSERNIPLLVTLSNGVSGYLDSLDKETRSCGMKVATKFSKLLGYELHFDDMEESDQGIDSAKSTAAIKPTSSSDNDLSTASIPNASGAINDSNGDSDSDSDLEAYEIVEPSSRISTTTYLKSCLTLLQSSETDNSAHDNIRKALESVPRIADSSPFDARDISGPLIQEIFLLRDGFKMENFEALKNDAVHALLLKFPAFTVPVTLSIVESSQTVSIGVRVSALSSLIRVSYALAGLLPNFDPSHGVAQYSEANNSMMSELKSSRSLQPLDPSKYTTDPSKTKIKRPHMLSLSRNHGKKKYYRNEFAPVANLLYFSVLRILLSSLPRLANTENRSIARVVQEGLSGTPFVTDEEGIEYLIPCKAFKALAAFTKCSINTLHQRIFLEASLKIAVAYRDFPALCIRRVVLETLLVCMESCAQQKYQSDSAQRQVSRAAEYSLASLMDISGSGIFESERQGDSDHTIFSGAMVATVDWATSTLKMEPDQYCRGLKYEIIREAVAFLDSS